MVTSPTGRRSILTAQARWATSYFDLPLSNFVGGLSLGLCRTAWDELCSLSRQSGQSRNSCFNRRGAGDTEEVLQHVRL
jgi:hypothetical protein